MNRPPGKGDTWWSRHDAECGGTYTKISEPKLTKKQLQNLSSKERAGRQKNKLDDWVMTSKGKDASTEGETSDKLVALDKGDETPSKVVVGDVVKSSISSAGQKRSRADANGEEGDDDVLVVEKKTLVECPICAMQVANTQINKHFDVLH
ncbi:uncharacterized protein EKO05_0001421 [Ascochyta rabiei]|nr:uncharacterized protein EKO05_0001421 [Ascochyta rabiei]UPX10782.1 hypothetical protein EKO05_0001421 [Ascochyta rabiei]